MIRAEHEIHHRRLSRNVGVGIALLAFGALIFGLTIAKVSEMGPVEGFDHAVRPSVTVSE